MNALRKPEAFSRPLLYFLLALTALRLVLAAFIPLSPDEAYYWSWSRHLQGGYVDHPFMVALWIKAGTLIAGETALGVRLLGPLSALLASFALFHAARTLLPGAGGFPMGSRAVLLFNATVMIGLGMVTMTPDTPLIFFVALLLFALGRALQASDSCPAFFWWGVTGLVFGLAFDAKYTALLLGIGLAGFVLTDRRALWRQRAPWFGAVMAFLAVSPVLIWNATHHWASFLKQGGRVGDWHPARAVQFLGEFFGGQIGLATPLIVVFFVWGVVLSFRRAKIIAWLVLPGVAIFVAHAVGDRVQANWPGVLYPVLALGGALCTWRVRWAVGVGTVMTLGLCLQAAFSLLPLSAHWDPVSRQTAGWPEFAAELAAEAREQGAEALIADDYGLASELAFYQNILPVTGRDRRWNFLPVPRRSFRRAVEVHQERDVLPSALALCRMARERQIRCYVSQPVTNIRAARLPHR